MRQLLIGLLALDALLAIGFGLYSWFNPTGTFGELIDIPEAHQEFIYSIFSSLSVFYVLLGMIAIIGLVSTSKTKLLIAAVLLVRHLWIGIQGFLDVDAPWYIGDPYPDLYIHLTFVLLYGLSLGFLLRKKPS